MKLPAVFINNVFQAFGQAGELFLNELPDLLTEAARRWELVLGEPLPLSYNYVCSARRKDGTPAVLKIGVPNRELTSEINALDLYAGQGACRLYESDAEAGMLLLERLAPGTMLASLEDDDQATRIAAELLCKIQRTVPDGIMFLNLEEWFAELKNMRSRFGGSTGPFPERVVKTVARLLPELFAADSSRVLLHGDFHHYNVLLSERGWLAIDPKGVVGPPGYEVGPLLMNPYGRMPAKPDAIQRTRRRIAILAERMQIEPERLREWAICHSLLSAWWDTKADGTGGDYSRAWTGIFMETEL